MPMVRALEKGYYGLLVRQPGEIFSYDDADWKAKPPSWAEKVTAREAKEAAAADIDPNADVIGRVVVQTDGVNKPPATTDDLDQRGPFQDPPNPEIVRPPVPAKTEAKVEKVEAQVPKADKSQAADINKELGEGGGDWLPPSNEPAKGSVGKK